MIIIRIILIVIVVISDLRLSYAQERPLNVMKNNFGEIKSWIRDTASIRSDQFREEHRFDQIFDWKEMTLRIFQGNWVNLSKQWQNNFLVGVRRKVIDRVSGYLISHQETVRQHSLFWVDDEINGRQGKVFLDVLIDQELHRINLRVTDQSGEWKINDIRSKLFSLQKNYFGGLDSLLSEGCHAEYVYAVMLDQPDFVIDQFNTRSSYGYPINWGWRKKDDHLIQKADESFMISDEDTNRFLQIRITDVPLVKPFCYNIHDYPVLTWKWRLRPDPPSTLVAPKSIIASLTIIFYQNWLGLPVTISYVWHGRDARCTAYQDKQWFVDRYNVVLRGTTVHTGQWFEETVHLTGDYNRFFNDMPPPQTVGIYFLLHQTETLQSFYLDVDDIRARRQTDSTSCP